MHIKGSSRLLHLAATAGVIWLLILFTFTLGDYFTRNLLQPTSTHKVPPEQFHSAP
jgi:hypothetical protein